jgi:AcrR family transcriptional regulator
VTRPGRPREFDLDLALDRALELFWRNGYEGSSVNDIAEAMGVSKPSLYAAFGDKEALYLRALARYGDRQQSLHARVLDQEPDARRAIENLMLSVVDQIATPGMPSGCMVVSGAWSCESPGVPASVKEALCNALRAGARALEARLARAQRERQLPPDVDVPALAVYFSTVLAGLSVQARGHQCSEVLRGVVAATMRAWPPGMTPGVTTGMKTGRSLAPRRQAR